VRAGLAWIFGSSRSGSTWLTRMLRDLDPRVVPIDDPHLGHHLGVWRPISLAWGAAEEIPQLTTLPAVKSDHESYFFSEHYRDTWEPALRDLISTRFMAQVEAESPEGVPPERQMAVVKEPGSQAAGLLLSLFPESSLVFLLRDGRDVVDSWVDAYQDGSWAIEGGAFPAADEGRIPLVRWLSSVWTYRTSVVLDAFEAHPEERRVLVRFEDLRSDTCAELERIGATLGLSTATSDLDRVAEIHSFERLPTSETGKGSVTRSGSTGGWRENLSAKEQAEMMKIMGSQLERLGYAGDARLASAA
jgi:sulfotransferase family protein